MRGVFVDANDSLAEIFERQRKAGDPDVKVHLDPNIKAEDWPPFWAAPRSASSITPRCRRRSRNNAPG